MPLVGHVVEAEIERAIPQIYDGGIFHVRIIVAAFRALLYLVQREAARESRDYRSAIVGDPDAAVRVQA